MTSQFAVTWIGSIILFGMYFLPGYIALHRLHHNVRPIFLTNLFLGWTVVGWLGCLIWAVLDHGQAKEVLPVDGQST